MRLLRSDDKGLTFLLSKDERETIQELLTFYPAVPPAHHRVSNELQDPKLPDYQQLLDEALADQRKANKRLLDDWLAAPQRFETLKRSFGLTVERTNIEWLLQVLNDIRVGNWLLLGSPEQPIHPRKLDPQLLRNWVAMELSGALQMALLEALH